MPAARLFCSDCVKDQEIPGFIRRISVVMETPVCEREELPGTSFIIKLFYKSFPFWWRIISISVLLIVIIALQNP